MRKYQVEPTCQIPVINELLLKYIGYKKHGYFVEVGAFDGQTHSNTSFLADLGWSGIYLEPVYEYFSHCVERHQNNDVVVLPLAVGDKHKKVNIAVAGEVSTTINNPKSLYESVGLGQLYDSLNRNRTQLAMQVTLDSILVTFNTPFRFDLLSIDTENTEYKVLQGLSILSHQPKMVIVEMHEQGNDWMHLTDVREQNSKINKYFKKNGYTKVFSDPINSVFVLV